MNLKNILSTLVFICILAGIPIFAAETPLTDNTSSEDKPLLKNDLAITLCKYGPDIKNIIFSNDGHYFVVFPSDGSIPRLQNTAFFDDVDIVLDNESETCDKISTVAFSPNSKFMVVGVKGGTVILWDLDTKEFSKYFKGFDCSMVSLAIDSNAKYFAAEVKQRKKQTVVLWDLQKHFYYDKNLRMGINAGFPTKMAFDPNGERLALLESFAENENVLQVYALGNSSDKFFKRVSGANTVIFDFQGKYLALGLESGVVEVFDLSHRTFKLGELWYGYNCHKFNSHDSIDCLAFSPDGKFLAAGSKTGNICVWDMQKKKYLFNVNLPNCSVKSLAFQSNDKLLVCAKNLINEPGISTTELSSEDYQTRAVLQDFSFLSIIELFSNCNCIDRL